MPDMLDETNYRNAIAKMSERELAESTALRVFFICDTCAQDEADTQAEREAYGDRESHGPAMLGELLATLDLT